MNADWMLRMFLSAMAGSLASLFWPLLIALWRKQANELTRAFGLEGAIGAQSPAPDVSGPPILRLAYRLIEILVLPFIRFTSKMILFLVVAVLIALVSSAVGFAAFLQDEGTRKTLESTGFLAFFSAFNYGFTAATLVSEPLKARATTKT